MARSNETVAALLQEYADLVSITGGDAFRIRVYERAARALAAHPVDVSTLDIKGLQQVPDVGRSIAEKVTEYFGTGRITAMEKLRAVTRMLLRRASGNPYLVRETLKELSPSEKK